MLRFQAKYELLLNFSMRLRVRLRTAVAGDVRVIAAKDQRNLFRLRLRANYELSFRLNLEIL